MRGSIIEAHSCQSPNGNRNETGSSFFVGPVAGFDGTEELLLCLRQTIQMRDLIPSL